MENIEYLKKQVPIMVNLFKSKRFKDLISKGMILIKKFPDQDFFYNITSLAYNALGKSIEAKKLLTKILKKDPGNISVLNNLGLVSSCCGDSNEAEKYYKRALILKPDFIDALVNLGNLKTNQNKAEEAKEFFSAALKIDNKIIPAKISLAGYYEQSGNFNEAKNIYREILKSDFNYTVADKSLSLIHKYKAGDDHIKMMEDKLTKDIDEDGVQRLNFALGKAYEDIGDYQKSFKFYETGNKIYKKNINFDIKNEIKLFDKIKKLFKNNLTSLNDYGQKIIFIVGMPRSGTTLAEQILSSHKNVYGAGELNFLNEAAEKNLISSDTKFIETIENLRPEMLKRIKDDYLQKIEIFKNKKEYLIDKAPLNFRWIGLIMAIFPNSKIIHCTRSPMDICWSNYKNTFPAASMNYSYDFKDLAGYYRIYDSLMKFWTKKFDHNIFNLVYEDLILDKEMVTKNALNFCGLDWDENCLDFHKNKKAVATASLAQIRQPLYNSSVEKWKNFSQNLEVLKEELID